MLLTFHVLSCVQSAIGAVLNFINTKGLFDKQVCTAEHDNQIIWYMPHGCKDKHPTI
jgi:hypothetical protein